VPDEPDVRFLLVHHTVSPNDYTADGAVELLRGIHAFHTGERGWPDIAYNFFVDRFGTVYEGRLGSLDGAKAVDATGGSQGFAQLGCFLGDHTASPPSPEAVAAMGELLGFLAERHGIDVSPGATVTFTSRGSNRWPAGTEVTASTVSGHRDMSQTACPGDAAYALVADGTFASLAAGSAPAPTPTTETPATSEPPATTTATEAVAPATSAPERAAPPPSPASSPGESYEWAVPAVLGGAVALIAAGVALRRRRL
jgi:hypothetical protein